MPSRVALLLSRHSSSPVLSLPPDGQLCVASFVHASCLPSFAITLMVAALYMLYTIQHILVDFLPPGDSASSQSL
jgi:hypothetical protein